MIKDYKGLQIKYDMLIGNINRMCVTDSLDELKKMYEIALHKLKDIYLYNELRIQKNI